MISIRDYAHIRKEAAKQNDELGLVEKYSKSEELSALAERFNNLLVATAQVGLPCVELSETFVASEVAIRENVKYADIPLETRRFICVKLLEWLRKNTMYRHISWTGHGCDFIIEP